MTTTAPDLGRFITKADLLALIQRARDEDLGPDRIDVTTAVITPPDRTAEALIESREAGRLAGGSILSTIAGAYDPAISVENLIPDGHDLDRSDTIARITGPLVQVLTMERVALNFACHLSGIATLTARYAAKVAGTRARIYDTRKTLPGLRGLQKYAVVCGGGATHRAGLHDAVLIKDNHLAGVGLEDLSRVLTQAIGRARSEHPDLSFVEVEVDSLEKLEIALGVGAGLVLLDNMVPAQLRQAVGLRDSEAPRVILEASGGVDLDTVGAIAATGVERISVGALTHSAPALDLALEIR